MECHWPLDAFIGRRRCCYFFSCGGKVKAVDEPGMIEDVDMLVSKVTFE